MPSNNLVELMDEFYLELLTEARRPITDVDGQPGPKVGFVDKLKLFEAGVKWTATKNKVDPEQELDEFAKARDKFNGRARGGSSAHSKANGAT